MNKIQYILLIGLMISGWITLEGQGENLSWQAKVHDRIFRELDQSHSVETIILFKEQADLSAARWLTTKTEKSLFVFNQLKIHADRKQNDLISWLNEQNVSYHSFWIINAIYARCNLDQVEEIAMRPEVKSIQFNIPLSYHQAIREEEKKDRNIESVEWGIEKINADDVWGLGYQGDGVVVGGQDTGYDWDHEALIEKYRGWNGSTADHNYNWHDAIHEIDAGNTGDNPCGLDSPEPCDDHSHGTHTMGTMVGSNGGIEIGVAPQAQWIGCRNMERGDGTPATYLECFQWFLAPTDLNDENPDPTKAPHVINNSWSCPPSEGCDGSYDFSIMATAIQNLESAGVVVVASAGNEGPNCSTVENPPAFYSESFSVGATNSSDDIANFSSRGPSSGFGSPELKPNVSAPGVLVYSSTPNDNYSTSSGTSMAGPHVAGAVALLISADQSLAGDVSTIKSILENTAVPLTSTQSCGGVSGNDIPNNTFGYGRIDILAAVNFALGNTPLDLLSFEGKSSNGLISLQWEVANVENEQYFEVEKSYDKENWLEIGKVSIEGNKSKFYFQDDQAYDGINYYRLKIVNDDGASRYSTIRAIQHSISILTDLYPNPVSKNTLFVKMEELPENAKFQIAGMDGQVHMNIHLDTNSSSKTYEISVDRLPEGIYLLNILSGNGQSVDRLRFIKQ